MCECKHITPFGHLPGCPMADDDYLQCPECGHIQMAYDDKMMCEECGYEGVFFDPEY
jgi:ribosomal protein S27E